MPSKWRPGWLSSSKEIDGQVFQECLRPSSAAKRRKNAAHGASPSEKVRWRGRKPQLCESAVPVHLLGHYPMLAKSVQNHGTADGETAYRAECHHLGNLRTQT
jgi:hypothetical protein